MASKPRGALIVFEGLDRAGKSTQCENAVKMLQERFGDDKVRSTRFPDRTTPIGTMISNYLKGASQQEDHVIHLLFSANRWEAAAQIESDINAGITVVIDRYYYSGIVYSAAKNNPTLDLQWARRPEEGLPRPDVCIFLDISAEAAEKRGGYGDERYEKKDMQRRVRELYQEVRNSPDAGDFVTIDGGRPLEDVQQDVHSAVLEVIAKVHQSNSRLRRAEPWRD